MKAQPILRPLGCMLLACAAICGVLAGCTPSTSEGERAAAKSDVEAMADLEETVREPEATEVPTPSEPEPETQPAPAPTTSPEAVLAEGAAVEERIANGDASAKICYLTFDDGPSDNKLDILRTLQDKGVYATFFIKGNSDRIDLVKDISDAGHGIGLHTFTHDYAQLYANDNAYFADLAAVQDAVSSRIGHTVDIVRFPGGTSNTVSANYSKGIMSRLVQSVPAQGYQFFDWNASGGDSATPPPPAADIAANALGGAGGMQRVCVLMHDTTVKRTTVEALPAIIDGLREQGYTFGILTHDTPPFHHGANN